jgi:hypothetical protein
VQVSYRARAARDDAVKGKGLRDSLRHAAAARLDGLIDGPLLLGAVDGLVGDRDMRDPRRAAVVERVDHVGELGW